MRVFVIVNQVDELGPRQTTSMLVASLLQRQHEVWLAGVAGFQLHAETVRARGRLRCRSANDWAVPDGEQRTSEWVAQQASGDQDGRWVELEHGDVVLLRTNPGRDIERSSLHDCCLHFCRVLAEEGVSVFNRPQALPFFASKASLAVVAPKFRPPTHVVHRPDQVAELVQRYGRPCVIKPLVGSRGQDVIRVLPNENVESIVAETFGGRAVVVQPFVDSEVPGDKRVLVIEGKLLQVDGFPAGIHRRPGKDDFRANLHAGASAHPLELSREEIKAVEHGAGLLHQHGIWLAGIDLIGAKIIEFNVFSTGGLYFAEQFRGVDFSGEIIRRLELAHQIGA